MIWLPAVVSFGILFTLHQVHSVDVSLIVKRKESVTAIQAVQYATAVSNYMRNNPGASGSPSTAQLTQLPAWFPKGCAGDVCFASRIVSGRAYITVKSSASRSVSVDALEASHDGSLLVGKFINNTGSFQSVKSGLLTLPVDSSVQINIPTLVVSQ
ncbi:type IV pilus biogenesis protein PilM [Gulbenkiania mobilis]|uniref:type IV pilus biogenesis protein PilM n=1 Tax=Gulbenkiania mobilis TaxID=397457 RepID=UPI0006BBEEF4|nr:type IV pilus biogenesis protein PilM [Gulbenkiania mobilis]